MEVNQISYSLFESMQFHQFTDYFFNNYPQQVYKYKNNYLIANFQLK